jgi:Rrf2 family protein
MKYSAATSYALHTMMMLVEAPEGATIGVQQLSGRQELSQAYLSKILTKLVKAGLIESAPGVNGGYKLAVRREELSFLSVIRAIEGEGSLFQCETAHHAPGCRIQAVMCEAERTMERYLQEKKLVELLHANRGGTSHEH